MKAMLLSALSNMDRVEHPLTFSTLPDLRPKENEIIVRVSACGVCHTELDEIEGRTPPPVLPVVPGHQIVGTVAENGERAKRFPRGSRVGVGWIFSACGRCLFCTTGHENLCHEFKATGRDAHGGYAENMAVHENFAFPVPENLSDAQIAPLLCAGAIGYRSIRLTGLKNGQNLGLMGFGASAHLVLKTMQFLFPRSRVFVFARSLEERSFARDLGATWAGPVEELSPEKLRAVIDTTPAWKPVLASLKNLEPGGRLVINAIRKEETDRDALRAIDYAGDLWMEKEIKSVANVTRSDISDFLELAGKIPIEPEIQEYKLEEANSALVDLKKRRNRGAKVLIINQAKDC
jgi:alcohol dehydrogenase, propanol-preferring